MSKLNVVKNMGPIGPWVLGPITKKNGREDRAEGPGGRTDRAEGPGPLIQDAGPMCPIGHSIGNTIGNTVGNSIGNCINN